MTLSNSPATRFGVFGAAILYTAAGFGALVAPTTAEARESGPYYTAKLSAPAAERTLIAGGVAWTCEGTSCAAPKGSSRALRVCRELQRDTGEIVTFTAKGEELEAEDLAKCNG